METLIFIVLSILYVTLLAIADGLFNRLVFGDIKALPYASHKKKIIYRQPEWRYIGIIFLVILPALPLFFAFALGGLKYVLIYLIVLLVVQWDMIFGKLVFNDWWGDTPSIALPGVGWMGFPLKQVILVRLLLAFVLELVYFLLL